MIYIALTNLNFILSSSNKYLFTFIIGSIVYIIIHYLLSFYSITFFGNMFYYFMMTDLAISFGLLFYKDSNKQLIDTNNINFLKSLNNAFINSVSTSNTSDSTTSSTSKKQKIIKNKKENDKKESNKKENDKKENDNKENNIIENNNKENNKSLELPLFNLLKTETPNTTENKIDLKENKKTDDEHIINSSDSD